jgi:hypothetical protein
MLLPSDLGYDNSATNSTIQKDFSSLTMNASERAIKLKQLQSFYSSAALETKKCSSLDGKKRMF